MLRVGVIGCGGMGRDHIRRLTEKIQGAEVVAVSDVFEESAKKAAEICGAKVYADSKELINAENVDAVFIVSPGFAHVDSLLQAIEAGKRIFCEKPLCTTAEDCLKVVKDQGSTCNRRIRRAADPSLYTQKSRGRYQLQYTNGCARYRNP